MAKSGFFDFQDHSGDVVREMRAALRRGLEKCAIVAEGYAKDICPVDTGTLRRSISHKVVDNMAFIGTNVEYAPYVELGTGSNHIAGGSPESQYQRAARPFLKPAASEHR